MIYKKFFIFVLCMYSVVPLTSCRDNGSLTIAREIATGPLTVNPRNPRYFTDGSGRAIYLTGSHNWSNLQKVKGYDFATLPFHEYLKLLVKYHHNFIRLWIVEHAWEDGKNVSVSPHPWPRSGTEKAGDGKPKFDLNAFNQTYFDRLRSRVVAARKRGLYVSIMLFDDWSTEHAETWKGHPFNQDNNINGIHGDSNNDGVGIEFHTLNNDTITNLQEAYVKKVIDTVNDLDNVLYEVANETGVSLDWQHYIINVIKEYEKTKPLQHPVGMTVGFPVKQVDNNALFNSDAEWISPNGEDDDYANDPPASDGTKVIIIDSDHLWGVGGDRVWIWKCFLRGLNPIYMDDLRSGSQREGARKAMGYTLTYAKKMNLKDMSPQDDLSSTTYCMANPGSEYLVYQPISKTTFTVSLTAGQYQYEWFHPRRGVVVSTGSFTTEGGDKSFQPPFRGDAVLYIYQK